MGTLNSSKGGSEKALVGWSLKKIGLPQVKKKEGKKVWNESSRNYASCSWGCDVARTDGGKPQVPREGVLIFVS